MVAVPPLTLLLATVAGSVGYGSRPSPHTSTGHSG